MAKPKLDARERELTDLLKVTRELRESSHSAGAMTAAVATIKQERDILAELAAYRQMRGMTEQLDAAEMLAKLPDLIAKLPEAAFASIAQAVDERRRRLRTVG